ncbi:class I SAM-dependent methyltransferase [Paracoccaceae bacterium]|nr:class I SAM-dependent methyltransferase [Paracoccaceae bacterium]
MKYHEITECRICKCKNLDVLLSLGPISQTGSFISRKNGPSHRKGPLDLVMCSGENSCGLIQLKQTYDLEKMYGDNYGYRSGLNSSMVTHLHNKIEKIKKMGLLQPSDVVIDIGSNDGTSLRAYDAKKYRLIGVDPTAEKFKEFYREDIEIVSDFFPSNRLEEKMRGQKAKIITSFSMFYDLESPVEFAKNIARNLDKNGIWVFEQSYVFTMFKNFSFDTICHEHLEYYSLKQVQRVCEEACLKLIDCEFNNVNGGSFSVTATHASNQSLVISKNLKRALEQEEQHYSNLEKTIEKFKLEVDALPSRLENLLKKAKKEKVNVYCLGASTKGNVLLQYCGLDGSKIKGIGEVNPDKFGKYTPGSRIEIVPQEIILADTDAYFIVLPWHFKEFFEKSEKFKSLKLVFPLPSFEISK